MEIERENRSTVVKVDGAKTNEELLLALHDLSMNPDEDIACAGRFAKAVFIAHKEWLSGEHRRNTTPATVMSAFVSVIAQMTATTTKICARDGDAHRAAVAEFFAHKIRELIFEHLAVARAGEVEVGDGR